MDKSRAAEIFMAIHSGNPREAPGGSGTTKRAFALCEGLPRAPRILDVGCGPGAQSLELAELSDGSVLAVDLHEPYLERLDAEAERRGLAERIETRCADMRALDLEPGSFDLVWSEGAIYNMGFRAGLEAWRPWLTASGYLAVSEATWLTDDPPEPARAFWAEGYLAMQGVHANLVDLREAGFEPRAHFTLPPECWYDYYAHLEARIAELEREYAGDPEAAAVFEAERTEIDVYRRCGDAYGYVFYVARRKD
jgi:SAM-dependent methyltransferase